MASQFRLTIRSTERTRNPSVRLLYSVITAKEFCTSISADLPVARDRSSIGKVLPRMLATPRTTRPHLGMMVNRGHCSTSRTLNTLIPYNCSPSRRNSSNSRRF